MKYNGLRSVFGSKPGGQNEKYLLPVLIAIVVLGIITLVIATISIASLLYNRAATLDATTDNALITKAYSDLLDAESSARGYVITGNAVYDDSYRSAARSVAQSFAELNRTVSDPAQTRQLAIVTKLSEDRLQGLGRLIALCHDGDCSRAFEAVKTNRGKAQTDKIQANITEFKNQLTSANAQRNKLSNILAYTAFGSLAVSLAVTSVFAYFIRQLFMQLRLRRQELQKTNDELHRSNRELQDFASVASHDLQEPLRKVQAFGDRLADTAELSSDGQLYLDRMLNSAGRMRVLIDDLLAFSRVTTKAQPFKRVDLNMIMAEVLSDLQIRVEETGASITTEPLPKIDADAVQIRQVFQNLISNAIKFQKPGTKPEISVTGRVHEMSGSAMLAIMVQDNGIGFDMKYLDRIFTIFQRLHGRMDYEGTGIGLAVVRKIAERHHGTVTAESAPGKGACFTITLPIRQQKEIKE